MNEQVTIGNWRRVPSTQGHAISPEIAPHWQRWEGPGQYDWIELPASMPLPLVSQIIQAIPTFPNYRSSLAASNNTT